MVNSNEDNDTVKYFAKALKQTSSLKSLQVWRVNEDNENKVWKEDVNIIQILAQSEHVAHALFEPFSKLYTERNPDFAKIAFLMTLSARMDRPIPADTYAYSNKRQRSLTWEWVKGLSGSTKAELFNLVLDPM